MMGKYRCLVFGLVLFKQKTAYEMRISDWSSDVCSSDLHRAGARLPAAFLQRCRLCDPHAALPHVPDQALLGALRRAHLGARLPRPGDPGAQVPDRQLQGSAAAARGEDGGSGRAARLRGRRRRSEEHTSELQSLMRISYAVFCLKKKIIRNRTQA